MTQHFILIPEEDEEGKRLDKYLADHLTDYSRSYLESLIEQGIVTVNLKKVQKPAGKIHAGDTVEGTIPAPHELKVEAENIPLDICYEDSDLLVVNKPRGMVVHPAPGNETGTLVNALLYHCEGNLSGINGVLRPGIVHRIDKDTSGLLVVCKNDRTHRALTAQFAVHSITRVYTAIVYHHFTEEEGTVNQPLGRSPTDRKKMAIVSGGRRAITHYRVLQALQNDFSEIECRLETGRTHQIRVHMASIGHPILGDPVYGPSKIPYHLHGQMLHAGTLGFVHPGTGKYVEFHAEPPEDYQRILQKLS